MLLLILLFFLLIVGLPFVLLYKWINKKKNPEKKEEIENSHINLLINSDDEQVQYSFMKDYKMWKNLSIKERKERLEDIDVVFREGKNSIKKEMISQGFKPGSKIIDIKYFSGLTEHGFTIIGLLIQNEVGGEIRELVLDIDLAKMDFRTSRNLYHSSGKERYYYLKNRKDLMQL